VIASQAALARARNLFVVCAFVAFASIIGCKGGGGRAEISPEMLPTFGEFAREHNERVGRISLVWANVVGSISYRDADGKRRRDQGEGHLQLVKPSQVALSIGKLGEVMIWLGADEERSWMLEPSADPKSAIVGTHKEFTKRTLERLGLPVSPIDLIETIGVSPLPVDAIAPASFERETNSVVFEFGEAGRRYAFDLDDRTLSRIEFLAAGEDGRVIAVAKLSEYSPVRLKTGGGFFPHMPGRIEIKIGRASCRERG